MPTVLAEALRFAGAPRGLAEHAATPADWDLALREARDRFTAGKRDAEEIAAWQAEQLAHLKTKRAG